MEYKDLVKDFSARTNKNLEFIEKLKTDDSAAEVYETTQLINSLLGLIILPKEEQFSKIPTTPLTYLINQGWAIPGIIANHPKSPDLRSLIRYLRNAVAHFNIEFIADNNSGTIIGLKLWNEPSPGNRDWEVDLLLIELRDITRRFSTLLSRMV